MTMTGTWTTPVLQYSDWYPFVHFFILSFTFHHKALTILAVRAFRRRSNRVSASADWWNQIVDQSTQAISFFTRTTMLTLGCKVLLMMMVVVVLVNPRLVQGFAATSRVRWMGTTRRMIPFHKNVPAVRLYASQSSSSLSSSRVSVVDRLNLTVNFNRWRFLQNLLDEDVEARDVNEILFILLDNLVTILITSFFPNTKITSI